MTGGTGFLGRSLLDHHIATDPEVGGFGQLDVLTRSAAGFVARHPQYADHPRLRFIQGSLDDLAQQSGCYTDIIHAADDTHRDGAPAAWFADIVRGAEQAIAFAERSGAQRLLFVSSGAVYGPQASVCERWTENAGSAPLSTDPRSTYGQGKRAAEHLCALATARGGVACVIARCFALLSAHVPLDGPYAAGNFFRDALDETRQEIVVQGDGSAIRSYLAGQDAAEWLFALLSEGEPGEAYNVGADDPVSVRTLAEVVRDALAPKKRVSIGAPQPGAPRNIYVPDTSKARALGLRARVPLPELVAQVGNALRARRAEHRSTSAPAERG